MREALGLLLLFNCISAFYEMYRNRWWCVLSRILAVVISGFLALVLVAAAFFFALFLPESVEDFSMLWVLVPVGIVNLAIVPLGRVAQDKTKVPLLTATGSCVGVFVDAIAGGSALSLVFFIAFVGSIIVGLVYRIALLVNPPPKGPRPGTVPYVAPIWQQPPPDTMGPPTSPPVAASGPAPGVPGGPPNIVAGSPNSVWAPHAAIRSTADLPPALPPAMPSFVSDLPPAPAPVPAPSPVPARSPSPFMSSLAAELPPIPEARAQNIAGLQPPAAQALDPVRPRADPQRPSLPLPIREPHEPEVPAALRGPDPARELPPLTAPLSPSVTAHL